VTAAVVAFSFSSTVFAQAAPAADAKIAIGAKAGAAADLAAGKSVKVTYTVVEGKDMASKVTITAEKTAPAKAGKEEAKKDEKK
jgi:hypothetical protein